MEIIEVAASSVQDKNINNITLYQNGINYCANFMCHHSPSEFDYNDNRLENIHLQFCYALS